MESENDLMNSALDSSESPCSALLERLKNLRKWQDAQRKELIERQSINAHQTSAFLEDENKGKICTSSDCSQEMQHQSNLAKESSIMTYNSQEGDGHKKEEDASDSNVKDHPHVGLSQELIHSPNPQVNGQGSLLPENTDSVDAPSLFYDKSNDGALSSIKWTQKESNLDEHLSLCPHDILPLEEQEEKEISQDVLAKSNEKVISQDVLAKSNEKVFFTQSPDQGDLISNLEVLPNKNECLKVSYNSNIYTNDGNLKYESDAMKKVHGLSNFMKHHADVRVASNDVVHHDFETRDETESVTKSKFTFLRKGEGTSRFGMKPVKLKPKICKNKIDGSDSSQEVAEHLKTFNSTVNRKASNNDNKILNITPSNYPSKASHRPIKTLKLQKEFVKTLVKDTSLEEKDEKLEIKPDESGYTKRLYSDKIEEKAGCRRKDGDKHGRKEQEELSAFERLEQLAEDSSFSSNSSTVVQLLQRGQHSSSSTPVRSPPPTPHMTPILSSVDGKGFDWQHTQQGARVKLLERMDQADIFTKEVCQQNQFPLVNVGQVLEQLKRLVRLEETEDEATISQEELKMLLESFVEPNSSLPLESVSHFANNIKQASSNPTSTPAILQQVLPSRPRVHFRPEGVEVLEYELSASDEENTLTDTPSIVDDTDLVTTSDLEILAHFDRDNASKVKYNEQKPSSNKIHVESDESSAACLKNTAKLSGLVSKSGNREFLQPMKLQFSPPQLPPNSASHYIWSIFGKEKGVKRGPHPQKLYNEPVKTLSCSLKSKEDVRKKVDEKASTPTINENENQQDVETYKTLLLTKVCELEKEMESFKKENWKLRNLQESLQSERYQLDSERTKFQEEIEREKRKLREYIDTERNGLWKEKQALKLQSPSVTSVREQSLEIVYLKEQLHDLQEETKKKESLHQFTLKKLNEKLKTQEEEIKVLKVKNRTLQKIEKENMQLKHELDRFKLNRKPVPNNNKGISTAGKQKLKSKTVTISSINKSLDRVDISDAITNKRCLSKCPPELQRTNIGSSEQLHNLNNFRNSQEKQEPKVNLDIGNNFGSVKDSFETPQEKEKDRLTDSMQHPSLRADERTHATQTMEDIDSPPRSLGNMSINYTELCRDDGTREIIYSNGNKKEIFPDGSVMISYYNGDRKEIYEDRTAYIYGTDLTSHTTFNDGKEILEFPNGQTETRFCNGSSEIVFSDNTRKTVLPDGTEICSMKDGTVVRTNPDGIKVFEFVSGQREVHTPEEKRREYPDGTVKILHVDGRTETRYKKGRVRIKDKEGNIITDTHQGVH